MNGNSSVARFVTTISPSSPTRHDSSVRIDNLNQNIFGTRVQPSLWALVRRETKIASAVTICDRAVECARDRLLLMVIKLFSGNKGDSHA